MLFSKRHSEVIVHLKDGRKFTIRNAQVRRGLWRITVKSRLYQVDILRRMVAVTRMQKA